jgi:hypothetical protein
MRFKQVPITLVALGAFALTTAQADNGNTGYNRMPNQPSNPYWQAPNWSAPGIPPANRQRYPAYNYPAPNVNRPAPPVQDQYRADPPPPSGPYQGTPYGYNDGPSAFNTPGYNPYRDNNRNRNKFWGNSGPGTWMNPNKGNMERGWDDMINSPSRMGKMPGGWTAPEVTMPNPVDMGDQIQENVQDLPEQVRNMDVGNDVK